MISMVTLLVIVVRLFAKMKNIIVTTIALLVALTAASYAGQTIEQCYNCRVTTYQKRVVKQYVPVAPVPVTPVVPGVPIGPYVTGPLPVIPAPAAPAAVVPTYSYVPTPEASNIYTPPGYPTNVPVAVSPNGCTMYVDPYDLFGQLFGGADLVQSCWTRLY